MSEAFVTPGLGWLPDYPDIRDITAHTDVVPSRLKAWGNLPSCRC